MGLEQGEVRHSSPGRQTKELYLLGRGVDGDSGVDLEDVRVRNGALGPDEEVRGVGDRWGRTVGGHGEAAEDCRGEEGDDGMFPHEGEPLSIWKTAPPPIT